MTMLSTITRTHPAVMAFTDIDLYKLTMGFFIWRNHPHEWARYTFINRHADRVQVAELIREDDLRRQIALVGQQVVLYLVHSEHLDLADAEDEKVFRIQRAQCTDTWVTVGLVQFPAELAALGLRFALLRAGVAFILALPVACLVSWLIGVIS